MVEQILGLAALIARPAEEEKPLLEAMCTAAAADLTRRLRDGVKPEDCRDSFPCAAALLAAGGLPVWRGRGAVLGGRRECADRRRQPGLRDGRRHAQAGRRYDGGFLRR